VARAVGVDPGTKSFDVVAIDGDQVFYEKSIPTEALLSNPMLLVEAIEEVGYFDLIAGPSGYGTPIVCNQDIVDPELFAREILLLSSLEDIVEGLATGEIGIGVYKALIDAVKEMWRRNLPVCYFPSVILLPTIPRHRKLNKVDMGTVDKLASTILAIYDQSREYGIDYSETSFILIEVGFGYNAVIGVENGKVVDGYGGTSLAMGFLTIGTIDGEVAVAGRVWKRSDIFHGGVSTICGVESFEEALSKRATDDLCNDAFKAMLENIYKAVLAVKSSLRNPREIIVTGRLARYREFYEELVEMLTPLLPVRRLRGLRGAQISKEAGQGYAILAEGYSGGVFKELIEHVGVTAARGTVLDWVYHPRLASARARVIDAYKKSLRENSWRRILRAERSHA